MNTIPNLNNEYLRSLNDQELNNTISEVFNYGKDVIMIQKKIIDVSEPQYIGKMASAMLLLCILKNEMAKTNDELSNYYHIL